MTDPSKRGCGIRENPRRGAGKTEFKSLMNPLRSRNCDVRGVPERVVSIIGNDSTRSDASLARASSPSFVRLVPAMPQTAKVSVSVSALPISALYFVDAHYPHVGRSTLTVSYSDLHNRLHNHFAEILENLFAFVCSVTRLSEISRFKPFRLSDLCSGSRLGGHRSGMASRRKTNQTTCTSAPAEALARERDDTHH